MAFLLKLKQGKDCLYITDDETLSPRPVEGKKFDKHEDAKAFHEDLKARHPKRPYAQLEVEERAFRGGK